MNILKLARTFKNDESGAVTVDWVVLTAALVGLGLAVLMSVGTGINTLTDAISGDLGAIDPAGTTNGVN